MTKLYEMEMTISVKVEANGLRQAFLETETIRKQIVKELPTGARNTKTSATRQI